MMAADASTLSPRARIALLTMQLKALQVETAEVEAAAPAHDVEAARAQLRERLQPLVVERTKALDDAVARAWTEAAAQIAAAHIEAANIREARRAGAAAAVLPPPAPAPQPPPPIIEAAATPVVETPAPVVETTPALPPPPAATTTAVNLPAVPQQGSGLTGVHLSIDAEAFARVFAAVMSSLPEQRVVTVDRVMPAYHDEPPRPKRSARANLLHTDVILMGLTVVIIVLLLAAWLA